MNLSMNLDFDCSLTFIIINSTFRILQNAIISRAITYSLKITIILLFETFNRNQ